MIAHLEEVVIIRIVGDRPEVRVRWCIACRYVALVGDARVQRAIGHDTHRLARNLDLTEVDNVAVRIGDGIAALEIDLARIVDDCPACIANGSDPIVIFFDVTRTIVATEATVAAINGDLVKIAVGVGVECRI